MLCITVGVGWAVKIKEDAELELRIPKDSVKLFATVGMSVSRRIVPATRADLFGP